MSSSVDETALVKGLRELVDLSKTLTEAPSTVWPDGSRCQLPQQECFSWSVSGQRAETPAGSAQAFRVTAVTRSLDRASRQQAPGNLHFLSLSFSQALLEAQSVQVLVVSYGSLEGAEFWLAQTGNEFDMVFDPERKVYQAFSLGSSEYHVTKRSFPQVPPQFIDDLFQMGGDFVLDEEGAVIFSHRSQSPVDRPSAEHILAALSASVYS
ncbi:hypothetical protein MHYP_G00050080 [Metynnis hypsauchen]